MMEAERVLERHIERKSPHKDASLTPRSPLTGSTAANQEIEPERTFTRSSSATKLETSNRESQMDVKTCASDSPMGSNQRESNSQRRSGSSFLIENLLLNSPETVNSVNRGSPPICRLVHTPQGRRYSPPMCKLAPQEKWNTSTVCRPSVPGFGCTSPPRSSTALNHRRQPVLSPIPKVRGHPYLSGQCYPDPHSLNLDTGRRPHPGCTYTSKRLTPNDVVLPQASALYDPARVSGVASEHQSNHTKGEEDDDNSDEDENNGEMNDDDKITDTLLLRQKKKTRTVFSRAQIFYLETAFEAKRYLSSAERAELAGTLRLSETQVKVWFQNRRNKWKSQISGDQKFTNQDSAHLFPPMPLASVFHHPGFGPMEMSRLYRHPLLYL